jgi:hypothetical protein
MNTDATDPIHSEPQGVAFTDSHKAGQHKLDETVPRKTVQRRIGAIIVFLVPVTAVFMTVIFFIKPEQQPALLRLIFLVAVCCFPALL